jgi:hypothetical protein
LLPLRAMVHAKNRPPFLTIMVEAIPQAFVHIERPDFTFFRVQRLKHLPHNSSG